MVLTTKEIKKRLIAWKREHLPAFSKMGRAQLIYTALKFAVIKADELTEEEIKSNATYKPPPVPKAEPRKLAPEYDSFRRRVLNRMLKDSIAHLQRTPDMYSDTVLVIGGEEIHLLKAEAADLKQLKTVPAAAAKPKKTAREMDSQTEPTPKKHAAEIETQTEAAATATPTKPTLPEKGPKNEMITPGKEEDKMEEQPDSGWYEARYLANFIDYHWELLSDMMGTDHGWNYKLKERKAIFHKEVKAIYPDATQGEIDELIEDIKRMKKNQENIDVNGREKKKRVKKAAPAQPTITKSEPPAAAAPAKPAEKGYRVEQVQKSLEGYTLLRSHAHRLFAAKYGDDVWKKLLSLARVSNKGNVVIQLPDTNTEQGADFKNLVYTKKQIDERKNLYPIEKPTAKHAPLLTQEIQVYRYQVCGNYGISQKDNNVLTKDKFLTGEHTEADWNRLVKSADRDLITLPEVMGQSSYYEMNPELDKFMASKFLSTSR